MVRDQNRRITAAVAITIMTITKVRTAGPRSSSKVPSKGVEGGAEDMLRRICYSMGAENQTEKLHSKEIDSEKAHIFSVSAEGG